MTTHGGLKAAAQRADAARAQKELDHALEVVEAATHWCEIVLHQVEGKPTLGEVMEAMATVTAHLTIDVGFDEGYVNDDTLKAARTRPAPSRTPRRAREP